MKLSYLSIKNYFLLLNYSNNYTYLYTTTGRALIKCFYFDYYMVYYIYLKTLAHYHVNLILNNILFSESNFSF